MDRHKILSVFVVLILVSTVAVTCTACCLEQKSSDAPADLHVEIKGLDSFGNCIVNIDSDTLLDAGYRLADYVNLSWDDRNMRAIITTNYLGLFTFEEFINITEDGAVLIGCNCASSPVEADDKVTISFMEKSNRGKLLPCTLAGRCERQGWMTDKDYVNFRNVTTTGMKVGTLYRSSNAYPLKTDAYAETVDKVIGKYDPNVLIGLKETKVTILNNIIAEKVSVQNADDYLFEDRIFTDLMSIRFLEDDSYSRIFQYIADNDGPYMIFCNLGKDRTGFVCLLLEALMGATYQEMLDDFRQTYVCTYNVSKDSLEYDTLRKMFDPLVAGIHDPDIMSRLDGVDFDHIDVTGYDFQKDAEKYLSEKLKLSSDTIEKIKDRLRA